LPLQYKKKPYDAKFIKHEQWLGLANVDLSEITELDFEQPRALYNKALDDTGREHLINNLAGHLGNVKTKEIKERQLSVFAAVDQSFSDKLAKAIGLSPVKPISFKPAAEAIRFQAAEA